MPALLARRGSVHSLPPESFRRPERQAARIAGAGERKSAGLQNGNPNASTADILKQVAQNRDQIREQLGKVLSPDQMTKWDTAIRGANEFLGEKLAA
jgi:hypothetical protein